MRSPAPPSVCRCSGNSPLGGRLNNAVQPAGLGSFVTRSDGCDSSHRFRNAVRNVAISGCCKNALFPGHRQFPAPCIADTRRRNVRQAGTGSESRGWYPWPDSNRQALRRRILNPLRLPIPPHGPTPQGLRRPASAVNQSRSAPNVSQARMSPCSYPRANQRALCSEVPWVKVCGAGTRPARRCR